MSDTKDVCVADTSTLVSLAKGDVIDCLGKLFRKVYIPGAVQKECKDAKTAVAIQKPFFEIRTVANILPINIHKGELEAISLALELGASFILVDDKKAFARAMEYNLEPLPYYKILILAKKAGFVKSAKMAMDAMKANKEGIQDKLYSEVLKKTGEL